MYGYPGVSFVSGPGGAELGGAAVRDPAQGPALVTLAPGAGPRLGAGRGGAELPEVGLQAGDGALAAGLPARPVRPAVYRPDRDDLHGHHPRAAAWESTWSGRERTGHNALAARAGGAAEQPGPAWLRRTDGGPVPPAAMRGAMSRRLPTNWLPRHWYLPRHLRHPLARYRLAPSVAAALAAAGAAALAGCGSAAAPGAARGRGAGSGVTASASGAASPAAPPAAVPAGRPAGRPAERERQQPGIGRQQLHGVGAAGPAGHRGGGRGGGQLPRAAGVHQHLGPGLRAGRLSGGGADHGPVRRPGRAPGPRPTTPSRPARWCWPPAASPTPGSRWLSARRTTRPASATR